MNICIIGGSGFIGGYLMDLLRRHHNLLNIDKVKSLRHKDISFLECDITDYQKLKQSIQLGIDLIVLLAAEHKDDVTPTSKYYDVNVEGTRNVLKVMSEKNIQKIIFTSSVAVYGLNKQSPNESSPTDPFNHYGKSKLEAEKVLSQWFDNNQDGKSLTIIRPTVVFGPGNRGNVYNLLSQISSGKFMMIGNGNNRKSMAFVENIAGFIAHCIDSDLKQFNLFNYIDKPDLSTKELVTQAEMAIGKKIIPFKIPYWFGYSTAKFLDIALGLVKKKNPISSVRVKKFCATTQFESITIQATAYKAPFTLQKGLEITIKSIIREKNKPLQKNLLPVVVDADA
jgi:nucleoside-diphosphate-sugar epimerase